MNRCEYALTRKAAAKVHKKYHIRKKKTEKVLFYPHNAYIMYA